jgi:hypothetical protein
VTDGVAAAPEFVALDRVRFVDVELSIDPYHELGSLLEQLEALASPSAHDGRALIARATITGSGPLHQQLTAETRRAEVLDDLRRRGTERSPFVWWQSLTWQTRSRVEVVDLRRRDDFTADLLRSIDEAGPDQRAAWRDALPAEIARDLAALLPDGDDDAIWAAAQQAALDAICGVDA